MLVSLDILKKHLNVEESFTDDDEYIEELEEVAEQVVSQDLCVDIEEVESDKVGVPKPLEQAIKLLVGQYYANREPVAMGVAANAIPYTFDYLKGLYKKHPIA